VEYLSVDSQVSCILLLMSLSVLLTINHHCAYLMAASHVDGTAADDLVTALEQVLRRLRLSLSDSRAVQLTVSTGLLHRFATFHVRIATQVLIFSLLFCVDVISSHYVHFVVFQFDIIIGCSFVTAVAFDVFPFWLYFVIT